ncbi:hypothetical protein FKM82_014960 [Ascaphus truei]
MCSFIEGRSAHIKGISHPSEIAASRSSLAGQSYSKKFRPVVERSRVIVLCAGLCRLQPTDGLQRSHSISCRGFPAFLFYTVLAKYV